LIDGFALMAVPEQLTGLGLVFRSKRKAANYSLFKGLASNELRKGQEFTTRNRRKKPRSSKASGKSTPTKVRRQLSENPNASGSRVRPKLYQPKWCDAIIN
jgi:hypothetical protein